eukprot:572999-Rhodomonas_salina.1
MPVLPVTSLRRQSRQLFQLKASNTLATPPQATSLHPETGSISGGIGQSFFPTASDHHDRP